MHNLNLPEVYNNEGTLVLKDIFKKSFLTGLKKYIDNQTFEEKREKYIENNQEVSLIYRGKFFEIDFKNKYMNLVVARYRNIREHTLKRSLYKTGNILEIKLIKYPVSDLGVGMHRDLSSNVNMIFFLNISGSTTLKIADDKERTNEIGVELTAGDVNILRAPRNKDEAQMRPLHAIDEVNEERIVLVIREINEKEEEIANPGNWRGF